MLVNLYYAPYPCQMFEGEEQPISPVRVWNPKSALVTLAAGVRKYLTEWGIDAELKIINTQVDGGFRYYKSIKYGPRTLKCYRVGGEFEEYNQRIREAQIHGISNNFTNSAGIVADLVKHIKSVNPDAFVVVGGIDASARPEFYINNGVDVVVQLEGEYSFAKVIEAYARRRNLSELVPCRSYRKGTIVIGGSPLNMNDLQPMSLDLIKNIDAYVDTGEGTPPSTVRSPFLCFETSRGCYQACSFCATPMRGKYRYMSAEVIKKHFAYFRSLGINNILFQEDNILSRMQLSGKGSYMHDTGRAEIIEIFRMARDYGFSWEFANGLEFGKFLDSGKMDTELMEAMLWSDQSGGRWRGCYRIQISLEFLGDVATYNLPKLRLIEEELDILKAMLDLGVNYQTFNVIIGHDSDDDATINTYLRRCQHLKDELLKYSSKSVPYFNIYNRALLPGSRDFRERQHLLQFDINKDPEVTCLYLSAMNTDHLSFYELVKKRIYMTREINGTLIDQYDGIYYTD